MSEIKALDKLRELGEKMNGSCFTGVYYDAVLSLADEIEAEIAASYMRLPCDADGAPIHVGEEMTCHGDVFKVCAVAPAKIHRWVTVKLGEPQTTYSYDPTECTHYKPRTLEDVLIDAMQFGFSSHAGDDVMEKAREFADEIREFFGE